VFSIDEGACKLTGNQSQEEIALLLAAQIKKGIKSNIGEYITCSIGIAPNRYLAKIATAIQKPNGVTVINPEDIPNKLFPLKLRALPGIGSAIFKKLGLAGIDSIQKLYQLNPTQLEAIWGSIHGKKCWYLLRGVDLPVETTKKTTIGQSKVIGPESRDEKLARNIAQQLILKAASRLRSKNLYTSRITLYIKTEINLILKESIKTSPINDSTTISNIMLKCWANLVQKNPFSKVKKVAVSLSDLAIESKQLSFDDLGIIKRKQSLSAAIDKINKQFGSNTISFGLQKARKGEGSAIAFGYIPEN
jgi:DNA polymerase IV